MKARNSFIKSETHFHYLLIFRKTFEKSKNRKVVCEGKKKSKNEIYKYPEEVKENRQMCQTFLMYAFTINTQSS